MNADDSRASKRLARLRRPLTLAQSFDPKLVGSLLSRTYEKWSRENAPRLGAALAFYTLFSLAPLLLVVVTVAGFFLGEEAARGQLVAEFESRLGRSGAEVVQGILRRTGEPLAGGVATFASLLTLFLGASLLVSELRSSLNAIWGVPVPEEQRGIVSGMLGLLRQRFFAFAMVILVGVFLLFLFVANTLLAAASAYFEDRLPLPGALMTLVDFAFGFAVTTVLFMSMYKFLPDVRLTWRDVLVGAAVTSFLFTVGRLLIALYLATSGVGSPYGAAGSVVVFVTWIYYSALVFFFGAQFTEVYATRHGSQLGLRRRRWAS